MIIDTSFPHILAPVSVHTLLPDFEFVWGSRSMACDLANLWKFRKLCQQNTSLSFQGDSNRAALNRPELKGRGFVVELEPLPKSPELNGSCCRNELTKLPNPPEPVVFCCPATVAPATSKCTGGLDSVELGCEVHAPLSPKALRDEADRPSLDDVFTPTDNPAGSLGAGFTGFWFDSELATEDPESGKPLLPGSRLALAD